MSLWDNTNKMLLIVEYSSIDQVNEFREGMKSSGVNINRSNILAIVNSKTEMKRLTEIHSVTYVSNKDISFIGRLKNDRVSKVLSEYYDMLIVIGHTNRKISRLTRKVKRNTAVGVNSNLEFLTINMNSESSSPLQLLNFAKETLQKIRN
ncbi:MAG: hypothetical protein P8H43_07140 [Crocinitomicaceae bacterium]|jgi:hypothetical protein|nr:hypothetical protein [Crocinitomicaceae bacterium]MDG1035705.1 hypothetical protein [Crocinitomicaceae bacterium]MDG1742334.1 hypothetical protein [Crocinitomicaceae bacterium]